jgi:hypothetical protein
LPSRRRFAPPQDEAIRFGRILLQDNVLRLATRPYLSASSRLNSNDACSGTARDGRGRCKMPPSCRHWCSPTAAALTSPDIVLILGVKSALISGSLRTLAIEGRPLVSHGFGRAVMAMKRRTQGHIMDGITSISAASARVNAHAGRIELAAVTTERHASTIGAARNPAFDIVRKPRLSPSPQSSHWFALQLRIIEGPRLTSVGFGKSPRGEAVKELGTPHG